MDVDQPLIDAVRLGRAFRAARVMAGIESVPAVVERLRDLAGIEINPMTLYRIERGQRVPALPLALGLMLVLQPPGGLRFFSSAVRDDVVSVMCPED